MTGRIFVQMASYRDPQLIPTLQDLVRQAARPERLRIVVCWQHGADEMIGTFFAHGFSKWHPRAVDGKSVHTLALGEATIELIDVPAMATQGACWARNQIQQHYDGEAYTLQLDSHHRFVRGWDHLLVEMLESLRGESAKPLLTAYLPAFDPDNDPAGRAAYPTVMHFDRFIPEGAVFFQPGRLRDWESRQAPVPARFYSAHFAFADGHFASTVRHDPEYFFHGEEISIAVRAFTHGYDLYHPHRLLAWHEYTRRNRVKVWDDHTSDSKEKGLVARHWAERNDLSHRRNRILFGMDGESPTALDFGKYGFGAARTLAQYEAYAGIRFAWRAVRQDALDRLPPARGAPVPVCDAAYRAAFRRSNDVGVCLHRTELGDLAGTEAASFTVFGEDGAQLHREVMSAQALAARMDGDWLISRLCFLSELDARPVRYVLCLTGEQGAPLQTLERQLETPAVVAAS